MWYVIHNDAGVIDGYVQEPLAATPQPPAGWTATALGVADDIPRPRRGAWFNPASAAIETAQPITLDVDMTSILSDGADTATISGLPDPCWLRIDNDLVEATSGSHAFMTNLPGLHEISAIGQYRSAALAIFSGSLAQLIARKASEIDALRDAAFAAGFKPTTSALATNNEMLQVRGLDDRTNWLASESAYAAAISAGNGDVAEAEFRAASNTTYTLTYAEGFTVLMEMAAWGKAIMRNSWALKDAVNAASDKAALDAVDITTGWPA